MRAPRFGITNVLAAPGLLGMTNGLRGVVITVVPGITVVVLRESPRCRPPPIPMFTPPVPSENPPNPPLIVLRCPVE